jgi:hypothetical protein
MNDKQLGVLYFVMGILFLGVFVALEELLVKPTNAQEYADKLCQEIYGPQTGATWVEGALKCQTARGEVLEMRKWQ